NGRRVQGRSGALRVGAWMTRAVARVMDARDGRDGDDACYACPASAGAPTVRSRCLTVVGAPEHDAGTAPPPWVGSVSGLTDPMSGTRGRRTRCRARGAGGPVVGHAGPADPLSGTRGRRPAGHSAAKEQ